MPQIVTTIFFVLFSRVLGSDVSTAVTTNGIVTADRHQRARDDFVVISLRQSSTVALRLHFLQARLTTAVPAETLMWTLAVTRPQWVRQRLPCFLTSTSLLLQDAPTTARFMLFTRLGMRTCRRSVSFRASFVNAVLYLNNLNLSIYIDHVIYVVTTVVVLQTLNQSGCI